MMAINLAAHQSLNLLFVEQAQTVSRFNKWTSVNLVIGTDNRWDSFRLVIDSRESEPVTQLCMASIVPA